MSIESTHARASISGRKEVGLVGVAALTNRFQQEPGIFKVVDDSEQAHCQHLQLHLAYWYLLPDCIPVLPEQPMSVLIRTDTYPMKNMFLELTGSVSDSGTRPGWALTSKDDFWGYVFLASNKALLLHRESFMAWFETQPEAEQLENWKAAQTTVVSSKTKFSSRGALLPVRRILEAGNPKWAVLLDLAGFVPKEGQKFVNERNSHD